MPSNCRPTRSYRTRGVDRSSFVTMAILHDCPGLKVEIIVKGEPLREWDDDEEASPRAVTKYIEAQSGANFALKWRFSSPFPDDHGVRAVLKVDNDHRRKIDTEARELHRPEGFYKDGRRFLKDGQWYKGDYGFTALSVGKS